MKGYIIVLGSKGMMPLIVYVDMFLLENFIVNYFLVIITSQTLCVRLNNKRALLSSILAAVYSLVIFVDRLHFMTTIPVKLSIAYLIVHLAYGKRKLLLKLKAALLYVVYTFILAGLIIFLEYKNNINPARGLYIESFQSSWQFISLMIIYIVIYRTVCYVIDRRKLKSFTYPIEIVTCAGSIKVQALLDTGNELKEPITNLPVIIVEKEILADLDTSKYSKLYIPYKVVNGQNNYLEAFKPEVVKVNIDESHYQYKTAVIGISNAKLSESDEYQALLSRDII